MGAGRINKHTQPRLQCLSRTRHKPSRRRPSSFRSPNYNTSLKTKHDNNFVLHMLRSSRTLRHTASNYVKVSLVKSCPKSSFYFYHSNKTNAPWRNILHLQLQIQKRLRYNILSTYSRTIHITLPICNFRILSFIVIFTDQTYPI